MSSRAKRRKRYETKIEILAGAIDLQAAKGDGPPSFQMQAYGGGKLHLRNFPHPAVIAVDGVKVHGGAGVLPILRDHDTGRPLGHGTPSIDAQSLAVEGVVSVDSGDASEVIASARNGFPWQASVGGRMTAPPKFIKAGKTVNVNGRQWSGPLYVVAGFEWTETSVVSVGADADRASTNIAATGEPMNDFEKWLEARGFAPETDEQTATLKAAFEAEANPDAAELAAERRKILAEDINDSTDRLLAAQRLALRFDASVESTKVDELRAQVEAGEITPDRMELELVRAQRNDASTRQRTAGSQYNNADASAMVAALSRSAGIDDESVQTGLADEIGASAAEKALDDSHALRGFNLHKLCHAVLNAHGKSVPFGATMDGSILNAALRCDTGGDDQIAASAAQFSTISVPGILSRVANKAMLSAYGEHSGVGLRFASTTDTNDLKPFDRYRMTEAGYLEELGATGEIKHSTLTEEMLQNQVKTFARMFGISEAHFINDDMGAFLQVPRLIGRMSAHTLERHIMETLAAASTGTTAGDFFTTASSTSPQIRPNYASAAGTALSLDSLTTANTLFRRQVDSDGKPILINPALLLVGPKNEVQAMKLNRDTQYRLGTSTAANELIDNPWRGKFTPLVSPYLETVASGDEDIWYLLPNPADSAVINVAFLRGQRVPRIQQAEAEFNRLGVQFRGVFRYGVSLWDRRLGVKMAGTAPSADPVQDVPQKQTGKK